jgi:glyoxylase-like metal-dependent hydrolase (beta-lactamase superfamily II)
MKSREVLRVATPNRLLSALLLAGTQFFFSSVPALAAQSRLEVHQYVADSSAFHVTSLLIEGPTEVLLIDAQYHLEDARRVAERISATGKRLKAIFITHPDHDHYSGAAVIVERFPGTPVYMSQAAVRRFDSTGVRDFEEDRSRQPALFPDSVIVPEVLPSPHLTVDGERVEILADRQGDVITPINSVVWIPSIRTLYASDLVFNGVHVWLGASNESTRAAWRDELLALIELGAERVIAGHKPTVNTPDPPETLTAMSNYLSDFDSILLQASRAEEVIDEMRQRYDWRVPVLLNYSAHIAFRR